MLKLKEELLYNFLNGKWLVYGIEYVHTFNLDCPLSKGNQAATPKIERPNGN